MFENNIDFPYISDWLDKHNLTWDQLLRDITLTIMVLNDTKKAVIDIEIINGQVRTLIEDSIAEVTRVREINPEIYHPELFHT